VADVTTVKLLTNIPITIERVTAVKFWKSKKEGWQDQISVDGPINGVPSRVYLGAWMAEELIQLDYCQDDGEGEYGLKFAVTNGNRPLTILRTEEGQKKKTVFNPGNGTPPTAKASPKAPQSAPAPRQAPTVAKENPQNVPQDWAVLEATYAECAEIACRTWSKLAKPPWATPEDTLGLSDVGLIAATATLFIECNKRNLKALPPQKAPRPLSEMPAPLEVADDGDLPFEYGGPASASDVEALNH